MDTDQRAGSRETLERLFWAGVGSWQPPSGDTPEAAVTSAAQASDILSGETAGQDAPVVECSGAAPHEPNPGRNEPTTAQELASIDSPAVQPVLIDANAPDLPPAEQQAPDAEASLYAKKRGEITELMNTLRGSVENVEEHGRRAESIVKNMLMQLRDSAAANQAFTALNEERLRA